MQMIELEIFNGDFSHGFEVGLNIRGGGDRPPVKVFGTLPPNCKIKGGYQVWHIQYQTLVTNQLGNARNRANGSHSSGCKSSFECWQNEVSQWLNSFEMRVVEIAMIQAFAAQPSNTQFNIRLPIPQSPTDDCFLLWKLPWHDWEHLKPYPEIEPILSPTTAPYILISQNRQNRGRVLAITGGNQRGNVLNNEEAIDLQDSIDVLKTLDTIELVYLDQPSVEEFSTALNNPQGWDIFFFTGHSGMDNDGGWFELDPRTRIRAEQFRLSLQNACQNGLQLAIFSSCDGVQLAQDLSSFNVPTIIAMREIIPNTVAQHFIKQFVEVFARSESPLPQQLAPAIRAARATLEGCDHYPGATNLPMIFQRSPLVLPTWQDLCQAPPILPSPEEQAPPPLKRPSPDRPPSPNSRISWWKLAAVSMAIASCVIGIRELAFLQSLELRTFDFLLSRRPTEDPDPRITVVTLDKAIKYKDPQPGDYSISDEYLNALLRKILEYQPLLIGLDIFRHRPTNTREIDIFHDEPINAEEIDISHHILTEDQDSYGTLVQTMVNSQETYAICVPDEGSLNAIPPPP